MVADHLRDRTGFVANGGHERREVVHAADEDAADEDPQECRHPAERHSGEDRADDRSGRRNRREMLPEQELRRDRLVVDVVSERDGGGGSVAIELEEPGEQAAIDAVGEQQDDGARDEDGEQAHGGLGSGV